ncbi:MAG: glycosyl transferase [Alphaproteobacteria bacterium]|nr:glycosyl transferase [Alphaproteobacteria bacterium]
MSRKRVLFYVQHLLGIGHQRRAATLTRAMVASGLKVTFVSGGHPIPNLDIAGADFVQLPPTRATDRFFKVLVDEHDVLVDEAWKANRRDRLLAAFHAAAPDALLFEMFPFGRRQMRFELLPLLEAAIARSPRPLVVSSVRDILVGQHKPGRNDEMLDLIERYFDRVLVHGDPAFIPFERTFPHVERLAAKLAYTGYVVDETGARGAPGDPGWDEVLVSSGGGAVGEQLLATAIAAKNLTPLADKRWRVLVGVNVSAEGFESLLKAADGNTIVERARGDFPSLLMNACLSISQGGYNTLMECLRARVRTVAVPYAGGIETEQTLRTRLLAEKGALAILPEDRLSPLSLAGAVGQALALPPPATLRLDVGGADRSAALLREWLA